MSDLVRLHGRLTDLAEGLRVRRVLPALERRSVGPFVFFDHFGPATLAAEANSDVAGHPHIGLATVTYLFEGRQVHRDSLGTVQLIEPGAVNWMTAGSGIVHSERTHDADRGMPRRAHGLQLWVALPPDQEACPPSFQHVTAAELPRLRPAPGVHVRVLVGSAWGCSSPVRAASATLYLDLSLEAHASLDLPPLAAELAVYGVDHAYTANGQDIGPAEMLVPPSGAGIRLAAGAAGARLVVIGGVPLERPVSMWWNFVSTDRQRIARAVQDWSAHRFAAIPGESDRIEAPAWRG